MEVCSKELSDHIKKAWIRDSRYITATDKVQGLIGDFFEFLATLFTCRERPDLCLQMAIHALVMSVAYEEGDKKSKEAIMRTIRWEQSPANNRPDPWYPDDDEFSGDRETTIVKEEVEYLFMITTEDVPLPTAATQDDRRPDSATVPTYHCYMCRRSYWG